MLRSLPGPVFFPVRLLAVVYADFFRGVPTILVIALLGFGAPALGLDAVPTSTTLLGDRLARARVHGVRLRGLPGRDRVRAPEPGGGGALPRAHALAGARLRRAAAGRPPRHPALLNDFIGLQKDTALVGVLGAVEAFKQAQIEVSADFNFTPYLVAATLFVAITIPLARFTDWLVARDRRQRQAGRLV